MESPTLLPSQVHGQRKHTLESYTKSGVELIATGLPKMYIALSIEGPLSRPDR